MVWNRITHSVNRIMSIPAGLWVGGANAIAVVLLLLLWVAPEETFPAMLIIGLPTGAVAGGVGVVAGAVAFSVLRRPWYGAQILGLAGAVGGFIAGSMYALYFGFRDALLNGAGHDIRSDWLLLFLFFAFSVIGGAGVSIAITKNQIDMTLPQQIIAALLIFALAGLWLAGI